MCKKSKSTTFPFFKSPEQGCIVLIAQFKGLILFPFSHWGRNKWLRASHLPGDPPATHSAVHLLWWPLSELAPNTDNANTKRKDKIQKQMTKTFAVKFVYILVAPYYNNMNTIK